MGFVGRRRRTETRIAPPIGRTVARTYPKVRLDGDMFAIWRADLRRRTLVHSVIRKPIGRALARTYAYPVKVLLANKRQIPRLRYATHSKLRIGRRNIVVPIGKAWPIHSYQAIAGRIATRRRIAWRSKLRSPVGRASARTYAYPIRIYGQAAKRAALPQRRIVHSKRLAPIGRAIARVVAYPLHLVLQAVKQAFRPQRRYVHPKLRPAIQAPPVVRTVNLTLTVLSRKTSLRLQSRYSTLTVVSRKTSLIVRTRQTNLTVVTRKTSITVRSR